MNIRFPLRQKCQQKKNKNKMKKITKDQKNMTPLYAKC